MSGSLSQARMSRNIEKSTIQYIKEVLKVTDWTDVGVCFASVRDDKTPCPNITVQIAKQRHARAQLGSSATVRSVLVIVDIRAKDSESNKLDLLDTLIDNMKAGWPYRLYETARGNEVNSFCSGMISVDNIEDIPINLDVDKSRLAVSDRYRHRLTFTVSTNIVEE